MRFSSASLLLLLGFSISCNHPADPPGVVTAEAWKDDNILATYQVSPSHLQVGEFDLDIEKLYVHRRYANIRNAHNESVFDTLNLYPEVIMFIKRPLPGTMRVDWDIVLTDDKPVADKPDKVLVHGLEDVLAFDFGPARRFDCPNLRFEVQLLDGHGKVRSSHFLKATPVRCTPKKALLYDPPRNVPDPDFEALPKEPGT